MFATLCRSTPFRGTTNTIICCGASARANQLFYKEPGETRHRTLPSTNESELIQSSRESQMGSKRRQSRKHEDEREELVSVCNWYERAVKIKLYTVRVEESGHQDDHKLLLGSRLRRYTSSEVDSCSDFSSVPGRNRRVCFSAVS